MTNYAFCLLFVLLFVSTSLTIGSNDTNGCTYTSEVGVAITGTPLKTLNVADYRYCLMECCSLNCCQSFNVVSKGDGSNIFLCEFFNKNLPFYQQEKMDLVQSKSLISYGKSFIARDCLAIWKDNGHNAHLGKNKDIYLLAYVTYKKPIEAVCDMKTTDGGWTLLQRRFDGSVDFYRDWESYKNGFGDLNGEFWLGLENAHQLMKDTNTTLRFDLWNDTDYRYQEYYEATIADEADNFRLSFKGNSGSAGDSLSLRSNDRMFTTKDKDSDENPFDNCAQKYQGAWWYGRCHEGNLNGIYGDATKGVGINWKSFIGLESSLSRVEIKVKRSFPPLYLRR